MIFFLKLFRLDHKNTQALVSKFRIEYYIMEVAI